MPKATNAQKAAISEFVTHTFEHELNKPKGTLTFGDLKREIQAVFGDLEFNWLVVVRSPLQELIDKRFMVRDTNDLSVERYLRA